MKKRTGLPHSLRPLFWDYRFSDLTWERDRDLIIGRILAVGDWESVLWLRAHVKAEDLKQWIVAHEGVGLNPPRLRFWELILGLPSEAGEYLASKPRADDMGSAREPLTFHSVALSPAARKVLSQISHYLDDRHFYLGGGTALALYLGHRKSKDFDWFRKVPLKNPLQFGKDLEEIGIPFRVLQIDRGTLEGAVSGIRVSLFEISVSVVAGRIPLDRNGDVHRFHPGSGGNETFRHHSKRSKKDFYRHFCLEPDRDGFNRDAFGLPGQV